jgi:hypothetical protein
MPRRALIAVGVAGLLVGLLIGAAGGETETVTETQTVVSTEAKRVPVVRVKTVTQVRRVVRTQRVTVEAAPAVDPGYDDSYDAGSGSDYAGLNCSEIGHSFEVAPGSDPEHDADNDGLACESY